MGEYKLCLLRFSFSILEVCFFIEKLIKVLKVTLCIVKLFSEEKRTKEEDIKLELTGIDRRIGPKSNRK